MSSGRRTGAILQLREAESEVVDCVIAFPSFSISNTERLLGKHLLGLGADFVGWEICVLLETTSHEGQ